MAYYKVSDSNVVDFARWQGDIPALFMVKDERMRSLATIAWDSAVASGPFDTLRDVPFSITAPWYKLINHVNEVNDAATALVEFIEQLGERDVDRDLVVLASILHDVDKPLLLETGADGLVRRSQLGSKMAHSTVGAILLHELGLPDEVVHLVATHSASSPLRPRSVEGLILSYADSLAADLVYLDSDRGLAFHRSGMAR